MLISTVYNRENTTFNINKVIKDITNGQTEHYFAQSKELYFAIQLAGPTPSKLLDKTYLTFSMYQASYIKDNSPAGFSRNLKEIEYELWGDKFPYVQK